jgi:Uncharacterized conserved protein
MNPEERKARLDKMVAYLTSKGLTDKPFNVSATVKVKPESLEKVLKAAEKEVEETRKEPGNTYYQICQSLADPCTFYAFEAWPNVKAFVDHGLSDHHQEFAELLDTCLDGLPSFNFCVGLYNGQPEKTQDKGHKEENC